VVTTAAEAAVAAIAAVVAAPAGRRVTRSRYSSSGG
jgi:hypothetical protein